MLDSRILRSKSKEVALLLEKRGFSLNLTLLQELEVRRKSLQIEVQQLQNQRNLRSREIGLVKAKNQDTSQLVFEMNNASDNLANKKTELDEILNQLHNIYLTIPNLPHESVPNGLTDQDNQELRHWGEVKTFTFPPRSHIELGKQLAMMDFEVATKITGSRFVVLSDKIARLQRALIQLMLDTHTKEHGYRELYVPHLVNRDSLLGTGQLPKFENDLFHLTGESGYSLISTAEIPITNLVRNEIIPETRLPLKYVSHTPCYRSEAGSYGRDLQGMIRHHQFEKVELVRIEKPENSYQALEELTMHAERILQKLELPYRVVSLCSGDLGFSSAKTYDLEVWLPSQGKYREISSCSNFESFQARRMQARYRNSATDEIEFLHTLNGSGLAAGRTLIALMENYQQPDGSIVIPEVLQSYMDNSKIISRDS